MFIATTAVHSGADDNIVGVSVATQALAQLRKQVPDALPQIVYVFASANYAHLEVLKGIRSVVGLDAVMVGASTAGEITELGPAARPSVAVMFIYADTIHFAATAEEDLTSDSLAAGQALGVSLLQHTPETLKLIMMFADGLKGNPSAIIRGIVSQLGTKFPIVGGSAGDNGKFVETKQFFQEEVLTDSVVGVGISGEINYAVGVNHGWNPVGAPRLVTEAVGAVIKTIDNKPAISLYADYLGEEEVKNLREHTLGEIALSYPLGIKDESSEGILLRAPFSVNADGSIVCGGEIKTGDSVQLMVGNKEDAIKAAEQAARTALTGLGKPPQAAFIFSCHVRNTLYENIEDSRAETLAIHKIIGADVPMIGFYTYAEQAPLNGTSYSIGKCEPEVHNETVVLVLMAEA